MLTLARGTLHHDLAYLHDKYGPVVRTTPDSLSFSSGDAWKEIYGHRQAKPNMQKDQRFYAQPLGYPDSIIQANDVEHKRQRKSIAHAFSAKALEEQQGIIGRYIDAFIDGLKTKAQKGEEVDIVAWFNWTTFDIIGDLTFGQNFACLEKQEFHPWIKNIFANIKVVAFGHVCKEYAWLEKLLMVFIPRSMMEKQKEHFDFTQQRVEERLELETSRKDFMTYISRGKGGEKAQDGVTEGEIIVNSAVLVIGGSETTATLLSGIIYYLLQDEECLKKLTKEIREKFDKDEDINFQSVEGLEYLTACLQEGLRCYPPVPIGLPRIVPEGGDEIAGQYVPGGVRKCPPVGLIAGY
jgi:cytochrome P450